MIAHIKTNCPASKEHIYNLLTDPLSGSNVLRGFKPCLDKHPNCNDFLEFNLSLAEVKELRKVHGVNSVTLQLGELKMNASTRVTQGVPRLSTYTTTFSSFTYSTNITETIPHSLYYCQSNQLQYGSADVTSGKMMSLSTVDCSDVDILVLDTGVDATHPDFKDLDDNSITRVVAFDWTQLKDGDPLSGTQIITNSVNFNVDSDGHGTACASLIAGNRCGVAKNARVYSINLFQIGYIKALKLALAFQKAKKLNMFGLNAARPTICSNSWGLSIYVSKSFRDANTRDYAATFDGGKGYPYNTTLDIHDDLADSYFNSLTQQGVHCVVASGNNNYYLINQSTKSVNVHLFRKKNTYYVMLRTALNKDKYVVGKDYTKMLFADKSLKKKLKAKHDKKLKAKNKAAYKYVGYDDLYFKCLDTGIKIEGDTTPSAMIRVGDVTNIGCKDTAKNLYYSGGQALATYTTLQSTISTNDIIVDNTVLYTSHKGPFFVKTGYSAFGPSVDIYAPGNGAWAAMSNQRPPTNVPHYSLAPNNKFKFFNGTSSAAPIVAGCLATWIAEQPSASPLDAKQLLLTNALSGAIMTTKKNISYVKSYSDSLSADINLSVPFGSTAGRMTNDPQTTINSGSSAISSKVFNKATLHDVLFCNRFFDSNNLIAQMNVVTPV